MTTASMSITFPRKIEDVWTTVTSLHAYAWRTDIERIEVLANNQFVEYTKGGYATTFTITTFIPNECWKFRIENSNMSGVWVGHFTQKDGNTTLTFTEEVTPKKWYMSPFVKLYLKKQQATYCRDLKKALDYDRK